MRATCSIFEKALGMTEQDYTPFTTAELEISRDADFARMDWTRPIDFWASQTKVSNEPLLVKLANSTGNSRLQLVSKDVSAATEISVADVQSLYAYLVANKKWRHKFAEFLQCIAETDEGELLHGWLQREEFAEFVEDALQAGGSAAVLGGKFKAMTESFAVECADYDEVTFSGFLLTPAATTQP